MRPLSSVLLGEQQPSELQLMNLPQAECWGAARIGKAHHPGEGAQVSQVPSKDQIALQRQGVIGAVRLPGSRVTCSLKAQGSSCVCTCTGTPVLAAPGGRCTAPRSAAASSRRCASHCAGGGLPEHARHVCCAGALPALHRPGGACNKPGPAAYVLQCVCSRAAGAPG